MTSKNESAGSPLNGLIELHYLPCIAWFTVTHSFDTIMLEKHEHFIKQSYRSRCRILTSQGIQELTVPLTGKSARMNGHGKTVITDIKIDYSQKWLNNHWRSIVSAYNNAPFFEYYSDAFHNTLYKEHKFLYDLNLELLTICRGILKLSNGITETMAYEKIPSGGAVDLRNVVNAKKPAGYEKYVRPVPYAQVFGHTFAANMSIIDLIFCEGPNARQVITSRPGTE
jgi:hypothetical protein